MARRRRPAPLVLLIVVLVVGAAIPALGLAYLWQWADAEATPPTTTAPVTVPPPPADPPLRTPLLSMRRTPAPLAERAGDAEFDALVQPVLADLPPTSCVAVHLDGEPLFASDPMPSVTPASNQKLLVAAVALDVLGTDHVFRTQVRGAPIVDGVVVGDLAVVGGGDPLLATADVLDDRPRPAFNTTSYEALADQLVAAGLTRVEGDIVGDGTRYDDEFVVPSWDPSIARVEAGPYDALMVNDGRLFGVGLGLNPNQSAAAELNRLLAARGVAVTGRNRSADTPTPPAGEGNLVLAEVASVPLPGVLAELLQTSDNNTAELLVKELGVAGTAVGTRNAGLGVILDLMTQWEIDLAPVVLEDGSGLARQNRMTCTTLVTLLERPEVAGPLAAALPVAGRSGTLVDELVGTAAEGVLVAKTGTLTGVKALSGYHPSSTGAPFVFSMILDEEGADDPALYRPRWERLVAVLEQYPVEVPVDDFAPR